MDKLIFGLGNAKISKAIATFSLPAGHTCPFAKHCLSKAEIFTGKITDGQYTTFRCFAASQECTFPSVRKARWDNFDLLKEARTIEGMADIINKSLPWGVTAVRVHVSGDFYNEAYFLAWLNVALNNPNVIFYGYTKALPLFIKYKDSIPSNFRFTSSLGGTHDHLITQHKMKYAEVVYSTEEARRLGLEIDHDDGHALYGKESFALLLHGIQPKNTPAGEALKLLRAQGLGGYSEGNQRSKSVQVVKPITIYVPLVSIKPMEKKSVNKTAAKKGKKFLLRGLTNFRNAVEYRQVR